MTYCVGLKLDGGIVFASDTRTNAGLDNIATFSEMHVWEAKGDRVIVLLSAGNLAISQSVVILLNEQIVSDDETGKPSLLTFSTMFQAAGLVGELVNKVADRYRGQNQDDHSLFNAPSFWAAKSSAKTTGCF